MMLLYVKTRRLHCDAGLYYLLIVDLWSELLCDLAHLGTVYAFFCKEHTALESETTCLT